MGWRWFWPTWQGTMSVHRTGDCQVTHCPSLCHSLFCGFYTEQGHLLAKLIYPVSIAIISELSTWTENQGFSEIPSEPLWNCWGSQPCELSGYCILSLCSVNRPCWSDYLDYCVSQSNASFLNICSICQLCSSRGIWPMYRLCDLSLASSFPSELRIPTASSGNTPSSACILIFSCLGRVKGGLVWNLH